MLEQLNTYDWEEAFKYASPQSVDSTSTASFTREDVIDIYGMVVGENDADPWRVYGRLKDKRYFYLEAGCDYTGWGCQESGHSWVSSTRPGIEREGLTDEARKLFGLIPDNVGSIEVKGIPDVDEDGNDNKAGFTKFTKEQRLKIKKVKNALYGMLEGLKEGMKD